MPKKIIMKERAPQERIKDFLQVALGYSPEEARAEAQRCLQCKKPACIAGCPVEIDIPGFIKAVSEGSSERAAAILKDKNNLPAVCGRVCPQENQCEMHCILGRKGEPVAIGNLERYAADSAREASSGRPAPAAPCGGTHHVPIAVVGSGPAGLTCAGDLARMGFKVTVFESLHEAGGVLRYGIPEFRLPGDVLDAELENIRRSGVHIELNSLIGRVKTLDDLFAEGFKAVFLGTGAGLPAFLNIPGENLNHIYSANEFLVRVNLMRAFDFPRHDTPIYIGKRVAVIGGGNTAMDACRTALRLGAEHVSLIYRRSEEEMPARAAEREHAKEEGVELMTLTAPLRFLDDTSGFVRGIECERMRLGEPDASGRRRPEAVPGSAFEVPADMVIVAVGSSPNPLLPALTRDLATTRKGHLVIDDHLMTSIPGVFAGGDIVSGETVIQAMGMGKRAAKEICEYLKGRDTADGKR